MEMNLGKITLGTIIAVFIGIIFVMAILPTIANEQGKMTTKSIITNESVDLSTGWDTTDGGINSTLAVFTLSENPEGWKITGCPISTFSLINDSHTFTVTTDYVLTASSGSLQINPTASMNLSGNATLATYTHCRDGYVTEGSTRSIVSLILVFAGLAVMGFVVYNIFKK